MRFRGRGVVLAAPAVALLAFAPSAAAGPLTLHGSGPITKLSCASSPCVKTLRRAGGHPVVTLTRLHAAMRGGSTQNIYQLSWKVGDSHLHLDAEALRPLSPVGSIALATISSWTRSAPQGPCGCPQRRFLRRTRAGTAATPAECWCARERSTRSVGAVPASGTTTKGLGGQPGGMVFGNPRAVPANISLPHGGLTTIGSFVSSPGSLASKTGDLPGDQVAVATAHNVAFKIPSGMIGVVLGSAASPARLARCCKAPRPATTIPPTARPRPRRRWWGSGSASAAWPPVLCSCRSP